MEVKLSRCLPVIACCVLAVICSVWAVEDGLDLPQIPGAPVRLIESDPELLKAVKFAEERYNVGSNGIHVRRVSKIISASKQVRLVFNVF